MIVGLAGKKGVGKSTAAAALENLDFEVMSFAATIKLMARILLKDCGFSEDRIKRAQTHKEEIMPILGVSYRSLCQTLGTEWGRTHVHTDLWVIAAKHKAGQAFGHVVFDDVRFENEARMIRDQGGRVIHIVRDTESIDHHQSESGICIQPGDTVLINDSSVDVLTHRIIDLVEGLVVNA